MYNNFNTNGDKFSSTFAEFKKTFGIGEIIRSCGGSKLRGVPVMTVFTYLFSLIFQRRSMNMDQEKNTGGSIKKDTCHRFLSFDRIDWNKAISLVALAIARGIKSLRRKDCKGERMKPCFVADDSSFYRNRSRKVELLSRCWDHAKNCSYKGFRMLTLCWTDGMTTLPVSFCNMSSANKKSRINEADTENCAEGSFGARIKELAQRSAVDALSSLIKDAMAQGLRASYLLCDRWFSSPKTVFSFLDCHLDVISMLKDNTTRYVFEERELKMAKIFRVLVDRDRMERRKNRKSGKGQNSRKYIFCTDVVMRDRQGAHADKAVRFVFVRNRNKKSSFLCIMCSDTSLSAEQIVEYYGARWSIEELFLLSKSHLNLERTTQSTDYLQIHASTAILMIQLQMIAFERRMNSDEVSYGALFRLLLEEVTAEAMLRALETLLAMFASEVASQWSIPQDHLKQMVDRFLNNLPEELKKSLLVA